MITFGGSLFPEDIQLRVELTATLAAVGGISYNDLLAIRTELERVSQDYAHAKIQRLVSSSLDTETEEDLGS